MLVAKIGSSGKVRVGLHIMCCIVRIPHTIIFAFQWSWDFAGWKKAGSLFDDGNCKVADVECKLGGWDTLPVEHGFMIKSGNAYSAIIANPFNDKKTMSQIFASVPEGVGDKVPNKPATVIEASVVDHSAFGIIGEHTKHDINFCQESKGVLGMLIPSACPCKSCGKLYINGGFDYHSNRPESVGNTRLGNWGSGSNSHIAAETSNYVTVSYINEPEAQVSLSHPH